MGRRYKQIYLQRRHIDGQKADEKMINITNYQRNANQSYNKVSPHTSQKGHHQTVYKNKCWGMCGENVYSWWECKLIQPLWKMVWRFLKKLGIKPPYDPPIPLFGIYPEETKIEKKIHVLQCSLQHYLQQPRHGKNRNIHQQRNE